MNQPDDRLPKQASADSVDSSRRAPVRRGPEVVAGSAEVDLELIQSHDGSLLKITLPGGTMLGWTWTQISELRPVDLLHPEDQVIGRRARLWCASTGEPQTVQLRVRSAGGRWVWSECQYEAIDFEGQPATRTLLRDASEMSMSQEALGLVVGVLRHIDDATDQYEGMRDAAQQVLRFLQFDRGYVWREADDGVQSPIWVGSIGAAPSELDARASSELREVFSDPSPWWIGRRVSSRDSSVDELVDVLRVPVLAAGDAIAVVEYESANPITNTNAELVSSVFDRLADALYRKGVEHELDMVRQQLTAAFNSAPVGMALVTTTGVFERANSALGELVDLSPESLVGQQVVNIVHPHDTDEITEAFDHLLAGQSDRLQQEVRLVRADDSTVWTLLSAAPAADREGEVRQIIVQVTEISAQKAREFQLSGQGDPDADPVEALDAYLQSQPSDASISMISIRLGSGKPAEADRIRAIGKRLRAQTRNNDYFAQTEPDRFVVVASGLPDDGGDLLEMIRQRFENSVVAVDPDIDFLVVASYHPPTVRARDLLAES